ncbi:MAG: RrF2 family transcriptional regulator [Lacipirellulaceae bacterium]
MLSAKSEYACLALARLAAQHGSGLPVQGRRLAADEGIPEGFLVQILQELKRLGLVSSVRGASGGYRLTREPRDVTLGEVLDLMEGEAETGSNLASPSPLAEALSSACADAASSARKRLYGVTLADLAQRCEGVGARMYYI